MHPCMEDLPGTKPLILPSKDAKDICVMIYSGVPGEIRGLEHLHKNYGRLPWAAVMRPAIQLARNGFPISEDLFNKMNEVTQGQRDFLVEDPSWAIDFAPNGTR